MENITTAPQTDKFARLENEVRELRTLLQEVAQNLKPNGGSRVLLTREQAAERLRISTRTLDTMEAEGEIRSIRIRGRVLYEPKAIDALIRACARR